MKVKAKKIKSYNRKLKIKRKETKIKKEGK